MLTNSPPLRVRRYPPKAVAPTDAPPPPPPPPPPVGPVTILSAVAGEDGQSLVLTFSDGPVSVDTGVTPDFNFAVGEQQPDHVISAAGAAVTLAFPGGIGPGDSWTLSGQPNWLVTSAVVPEDGSVA